MLVAFPELKATLEVVNVARAEGLANAVVNLFDGDDTPTEIARLARPDEAGNETDEERVTDVDDNKAPVSEVTEAPGAENDRVIVT